MAYVINDECIACGSCEMECPCEAISAGDVILSLMRKNVQNVVFVRSLSCGAPVAE